MSGLQIKSARILLSDKAPFTSVRTKSEPIKKIAGVCGYLICSDKLEGFFSFNWVTAVFVAGFWENLCISFLLLFWMFLNNTNAQRLYKARKCHYSHFADWGYVYTIDFCWYSYVSQRHEEVWSLSKAPIVDAIIPVTLHFYWYSLFHSGVVEEAILALRVHAVSTLWEHYRYSKWL